MSTPEKTTTETSSQTHPAVSNGEYCPPVESPADGDSPALSPQYANVKTAVTRYRNRLGVIPEFVPFAGRTYNRLRLLWWATDHIENLPPTRQYITRTHLVEALDMFKGGQGYSPACIPEEFFLYHGAYPTDGEGAIRRNHFANPTYVHQHTLPSVTDDAERAEWLARYAALGRVEYAQVAPHFGMTHTRSVADLTRRVGFDWQAEREAGRRRLERTWALCERWGYEKTVIAEAFGTTYKTVDCAIRRRRRAGFRAPDRDPTLSWRSREYFDHANVDPREPRPAGFERDARGGVAP